MFLTDARELGAREVAPDALLVKLPKKKRKIKNQTNQKKIQKIERKSLWTLAVGTVCGPGYQVFGRSVFGPPNRPMVGYSQYPRYHSTPNAKATSRVRFCL